MANTTHSFELPIFVGSNDYHEFEAFVNTLNKLQPKGGPKIKYHELHIDPEIGYGVDVELSPWISYVAVVYSGKKDKHIKQLISDFHEGNL